MQSLKSYSELLAESLAQAFKTTSCPLAVGAGHQRSLPLGLQLPWEVGQRSPGTSLIKCKYGSNSHGFVDSQSLKEAVLYLDELLAS